jgi:hypothetical protein
MRGGIVLWLQAFLLALVLSSTADAATLVGYWNFEEEDGLAVLDQSGFDNHGQLSGGTRAVGKVGQGLSCGDAGGVTIPHSPTLDAFPNGFTFSAWIHPTSYPDFITIFWKTDRHNLIHQLHFQVDGRLHAAMNTPAHLGGFGVIGPETVALNEWQYVAWTFDGTTMRLYDDGVEVLSAPYTTPWAGNDVNLLIGQHQEFPFAHFHGLIDEARVYAGALTPQELARDRNARPSLLSNGSFEEGKVGWQGLNQHNKVLTTETAFDEQVSARITLGTKPVAITHKKIAIDGGKTYQIEAAIRTVDATGPAFVQLSWLDGGQVLRVDTFGHSAGTNDWTLKVSDPLTAPLDATHLKLQLVTENGSGKAYFDAVRLERH